MVLELEGAAFDAGSSDDVLLPFQIKLLRVRGRLVRFGPAINRLLTCRPYPVEVAQLLGSLSAGAVLLASALKFDGVLTAQIKSDGPVSLLVADFATPSAVRGYARFDVEAVAAAASDVERYASPVPNFLGRGHFAVTVDQSSTDKRYQGIVELTGSTLDECFNHYLEQSEQRRTFVRLAVRSPLDDAVSAWRAGGLMLQQVSSTGGLGGSEPAEGFDERQAWRGARALAETVHLTELTDDSIGPARLLRRLFHEPGVRVFRARPLAHRCRCERMRVKKVLATFDRTEMQEMVVAGAVTVTCEFCNAHYVFAPEELGLASDA